MTWSSLPLNPSLRTLRQFAAAWLVFFAGLGAHQYVAKGNPSAGLALGLMALLVGMPGLIRPGILRWVFVTWMVLAFPIGWLISNLILAVMFYGLITPMALVFKMRGRDALNRKPEPSR